MSKEAPFSERVSDIVMHERIPVTTSDADCPIDAYRVTGGWLYHARAMNAGNFDTSVALCFVPDCEEYDALNHFADDQSARAQKAETELLRAKRFLLSKGYKPCTASACNCGQWHRETADDYGFLASAAENTEG